MTAGPPIPSPTSPTTPTPPQAATATAPPSAPPVVTEDLDTLLLCATPISTYVQEQALTNASGFFFERGERLFLVTSRHVVYDEPSAHFPDRLGLLFHTSGSDLTQAAGFSVPLYRDARALWRQGKDSGGEIDVAMIELEREALPAKGRFAAFTPEHLQVAPARVEPGCPVLVLGFPLGFHDTLHHLPVVRQAAVASAYGIRFQGQGYFLTDARTHRGTSGAPVVMRDAGPAALPWKLLGVHSARLDMANRDRVEDESLGLNCAWYADILMTLSEG